MIKTNKNQEHKTLVYFLIFLLVLASFLLILEWVEDYKEDKEEELMKELTLEYYRGRSDGQIQLVKDIHYFKEFPYLIYDNNKTIINTIKMCNSNFLKYYYNEVCR